jgi:glycosyltransferase involved in cell wall biosynthesis
MTIEMQAVPRMTESGLKESRMDRRFHILHVIPTLGSGGAERLLVTYLSNPALNNARFRHTIVLTDVRDLQKQGPKTFLARSFRDMGHEVIALGHPGSKRIVRCVRALRKVIREKKADLLHTHLGWANIAGQIAGRLSGVPVVTTFHSTSYSEEARQSFGTSPLKFATLRRIDGFCARRFMNQGIAVSQCVADHVSQNLHIDRDRIKVVYNPVDLKHIEPRHEDPRRFVLDELGLPDSSRFVINVGRVIVSKAHIDLIEAFAKVSPAHPDAYLIIIGNQPEIQLVETLRQRIDELGLASRVLILPPRLDISEFLAASEVFAFPSRYEGLPLALTEAMAAGVPCVASDIGPNREVIRDGISGLIVPVGDTSAMADAILQILDDQRLAKRLGGQAKMDVHEKFHPDRKAEDLANLYVEILQRKRAYAPN